jgi:hypothetical protein
VLIGTGVVMGATALAAAGVHLRRSDEPGPAPAGSPDSELDALADAAVSAGPRRDGIPPIDEPRFVDADAADLLSGDEPVFGLRHRGEVKAYPQQVLVWHEIVNDTVGGAPLAVTYCPLTGTVVAYPSPPGQTWTFGTTGRLVYSNLLMYDRQTESEWPQILGVAISGPRKGTRLDTVPLVWTTWRAWRAAHPDTRVLSTDTGALRDYGSDPYGSYLSRTGYYFEHGTYFPVRHISDHYDAKEVVIGVRAGSDRIAILKERLRRDKSVRLNVNGAQWLAQWDDRLDSAVVVRTDTGELADFLEAMWFAWYTFYPETTVV